MHNYADWSKYQRYLALKQMVYIFILVITIVLQCVKKDVKIFVMVVKKV